MNYNQPLKQLRKLNGWPRLSGRNNERNSVLPEKKLNVSLLQKPPSYDLPIVPVNINCQVPSLSPMHRVHEFGRALRRACESVSDRIALIGTGGISHWAATPDSGRINEAWDRAFLDQFIENRRDELVAYNDEEIYREGGQGGFEIRTFVAVAGATEGTTGELWLYLPVPTFSVGCTIATMAVA